MADGMVLEKRELLFYPKFAGMINQLSFDAMLENLSRDFHPLVPFDKKTDKVALLDLSKANPLFTEGIYSDMDQFEKFIENSRKQSGAKYLLGGYNEERQMYRRSVLFDRNISDAQRMVDEPDHG